MAKGKLLLIDGNNLLHRAYHKFSRMAGNNQKSSIVFGFPYILKSLIDMQKPTDVLVIFDGGKAKERRKLLPEYKKREKKSDFDYDNFIAQKKATEKILKCLGIAFTQKKGVEADDIIWLYARNYVRKRKGSVVIVSTDKDFHQLINKHISIHNPWKNERITYKSVKSLFGYEPNECVDYLILDGDNSDNIKGYPGVGKVTALKFIEKYGSIKRYLFTYDFPEDKKLKRDKLCDLFYLNRNLIDIRRFCRQHLSIKDVPIISPPGKKIKKKKLALICSNYGINIFNKQSFQTTFKNLLQ